MQRYQLIDTHNPLNPKAMAESNTGNWVKFSDVTQSDQRLAGLHKLATDLGYDTPELALDALIHYVGQ